MKNFIRIPSLYLFASVFLTGCVSISTQKVKLETASALGNLECVPYARERSGISIYGDAYTWWTQARGRYRRSAQPASGSVMVLVDYAGPERGHLAVVRGVISEHEIRVDHANWLDDGAIYLDDPVVDVSAAKNWSQVRVWNIPGNSWGARVYTVQGFIGPIPAAPTSSSMY